MDTKKAIIAIYRVCEGVQNNEFSDSWVKNFITEIYKDNSELAERSMAEWKRYEGNIFCFYANLPIDIQFLFLKKLNIEIKYKPVIETDIKRAYELIASGIDEKKHYELLTLQKFYQFINNNSLMKLNKIIPGDHLENLVEEENTHWGNYKNWSIWWLKTPEEQKIFLIDYIWNNPNKL